MKKSINLNSSEWCDMVFEGRNKSYGAYKLRQTASKRYIWAFVITLALMVFVGFLPNLVGAIDKIAGERAANEAVTSVFTEIPINNEVEEKKVIKEQTTPPPPPIETITTVKFTPPVITEDEKIEEKDMMKGQTELNSTKERISLKDHIGNATDGKGIDIKELEQIQTIVVEKPKDPGPIGFAEVMPQFAGGDSEMYQFIAKNLKYPITAQELGLQGKVMVRFVVSKTGKISDVTVLRGFDQACDREAARVVGMMPNWLPGKQNGVPVAVYYTIPIVFKLKQ